MNCGKSDMVNMNDVESKNELWNIRWEIMNYGTSDGK